MMAKVEAPHMTDAEGRYSTDIAVSLEGSGGSYRVTYSNGKGEPRIDREVL